MSYPDINSYINKIGGITSDAISLAQYFAASAKWAAGAFTPPHVTLQTTKAVLKDPTYVNGSLPTAPSLDSISGIALPDASKNNTTFNTQFPVKPPVFLPPTENATFSETYPATWLKDRVRETIRKLWNETGFETVEIDIWLRGHVKNLQALYDAEDLTIAKNAMSGWSMPNDIIDRQLNELNAKFDNNRITVNADITAKMLDLAQKNAQFGIEQGLNGEAMFVAYFNRYADRALKAARVAAGKVFDNLNAKVAGYNAYLQANETHIRAMSEIEKEQITQYIETLNANEAEFEAKLQILVDNISTYKLLLGASKELISSQKAQGETEMAWREIKFKELMLNLLAELHNAIADMKADNEQTEMGQYGVATEAQIMANDVAAMLGEMQVMLKQEYAEITDVEL